VARSLNFSSLQLYNFQKHYSLETFLRDFFFMNFLTDISINLLLLTILIKFKTFEKITIVTNMFGL